jgi:hypothetical protein
MRTGDKTYADRKRRYDFVMERLQAQPRPSYEQIGKEIGETFGTPITRQNVGRMVKRGMLRPAGRPFNYQGRRNQLESKLAYWTLRRDEATRLGREHDKEDQWIAKYEADIRELDATGGSHEND